MKKFIISVFALVLSVAIAAPITYAANTQFNNDSNDLDTVMVANDTQNPCGVGYGAGCWSTSVSAKAGDVISVQVYYHNTGNDTALNTSITLSPKSSGSSTNHTFRGGVGAENASRVSGSASVSLSSAQTLTFIPGSLRWYPNQSDAGHDSSNENNIFNGGIFIGDIDAGWDSQGTVVASYKVSNNTTSSDNDCEIDSFDADDTSIDEGDSTDLIWRTTGCDYVDITSSDRDFDNENPDDSVSVSPDSTTSYTLKAYDDNGDLGDTATVRVSVDDDNGNTCDIDDFDASPSSIDRGSTSTLRWSTSGDVDYVTISGLSGNRAADGSVSVSPSGTTTYTLRARCDNGDTETETTTLTVRSTQTVAPQVITTVVTGLTGTSARLNGIAVPNTTTQTTTAWFEWGIGTSLGNRTLSQVVPLGNNQYPYNHFISGLVPGATYSYRAAIQNQNGIFYGSTVSFQTTRVVTPSTQVSTVRSSTVRNTVVAQSAASLLELRVESNYDRMCINGQIDYTITYRNVSNQVLEKTVLQFNHPKEITYLTASRGTYEVVDRTMTIDLGSVKPGEEGIVTIRARVNDSAIRGNLTVATATVVYTNTVTRVQEDAIAYSLITVSDDCPNNLGANVFGFGSFLPDTLLEWLLLILVILALIVLGRHMYRKNEQPS